MSLLLGVALLGSAVVGRHLLRSWLAPGAYFALYWSLAFVVPMVALPSDPVPASAVLWVALAVAAVGIGSALPYRVATKERVTAWVPTGREAATLTRAMIVCSGIGLGAPLVAMWTAGFSISDVFSTDTLFTMARVFSVGRYEQTYEPPGLSQALLPFLLAAPLLGGVVAASAARPAQRLLSIFPFLPALAMTLSQTQRAVTLNALVLWLSGYLATRVARGFEGLFTRRHVVVGGASTIVFFGLFFLAGWARLAAVQRDVLRDVGVKVVGTAVGHATVFGRWFDSHAFSDVSPTWGVYTLAGPMERLGLGQRKPGLFEESLVLDNGDDSNLYTVFRPLIEDFTVAGALLVLVLAGIVAGAAYVRARNGRLVAVTVLAAFYASTLYGFVTSIWIYNSVSAAFLLCGLVLWRLRAVPA